MNDVENRLATEALAAAVVKAGSQSEFARQLGVSQNAVSRWLRLQRPLPDKHVRRVAEELKLASKEDLRPDLYPRESPLAAPSTAFEHAR